MSWLPQGYEVPEVEGNYMKWKKGANKFRVLSAPIMGWEYWTKDKKPVRSKTEFVGIPANAKLDVIKNKDGTTREEFRPKHFWAFLVWNTKAGKAQILEITQASVQGPIQDLAMSEDWGSPQDYDITVTAKGDGMEREYTVMPSPKSPVVPEARASAPVVNLEAMFEGKDPFSGETVAAPSVAYNDPDEIDKAFEEAGLS